MKTVGAVVAALGVALLAAGLYLGYSSVNRAGVDCGSALGGATNNGEVQDVLGAMEGGPASLAASDACASALSDRHTLTYVLLIPGGLLLLVGGGIARAATQAREPEAVSAP